MPTADLEIVLRGSGTGHYAAEMHFRRPQTDAQVAPASGRVLIDFQALGAAGDDGDAYGRRLSGMLFADRPLRERFVTAWAVARSLKLVLRVKVAIDRESPELHGVRWETLRDPDLVQALATDQSVLLSRWLSGNDWLSVQPRAPETLRALIAVANPNDLETYHRGAGRSTRSTLRRSGRTPCSGSARSPRIASRGRPPSAA
jgi:hypothetical protein